MSLLKTAFVWCLWLGLLELSFGEPTTRHYIFDLEYMIRKPDCIEHVVMGINGQFPGPTISAEVGDSLDIALTNKLSTEGTVIHWHGIRQIDTPWADGTAAISQCAIYPGETFHYRFKVDRPGTYFYHGHYAMQRAAGLYGEKRFQLWVDVAGGIFRGQCYETGALSVNLRLDVSHLTQESCTLKNEVIEMLFREATTTREEAAVANQRVVEADQRTKELQNQFLIDMAEFRQRMTTLEHRSGGVSCSTSRPHPHYDNCLERIT